MQGPQFKLYNYMCQGFRPNPNSSLTSGKLLTHAVLRNKLYLLPTVNYT